MNAQQHRDEAARLMQRSRTYTELAELAQTRANELDTWGQNARADYHRSNARLHTATANTCRLEAYRHLTDAMTLEEHPNAI